MGACHLDKVDWVCDFVADRLTAHAITSVAIIMLPNRGFKEEGTTPKVKDWESLHAQSYCVWTVFRRFDKPISRTPNTHCARRSLVSLSERCQHQTQTKPP